MPLLSTRAATLSYGISPVKSLLSGVSSYHLLPASLANYLAPFDAGETDLAVTKSASSESAQANSNVTFTIVVRNNGLEPAANVLLNDTLPQGFLGEAGAADMTFVSLTQNSGPTFDCSTPAQGSTGQISCALASLGSGEVASFTLVGHIPSGTPQGTYFTNIATVTTETIDTNEENNSATATVQVPVQSVDMGVTKTTGSDIARADTDVVYTIEVRNGGTNAAANVHMVDTLPGDTTFVSLTQNSGPTFSCFMPAVGAGGTVDCSIASLPAGGSAVFKLTVHIPSSADAGTEYTNTATVSTDTSDTNEENNSSTFTTLITDCSQSSQMSLPLSNSVTTSADSGEGSLRQVIFSACPGSTITFASSVTQVTLTSAELVIDKNLRIQGPGADKLTITRDAGASDFRIFTINSGSALTISGLTISNGRVSGGLGGAILNNGGTLNLVNSALTGNSASKGSAIYNSASSAGSTATLTVTNSTISGNTGTGSSGDGGTIYNSAVGVNSTAALTVTNSTISGNNVGVGSGGGIVNFANNGGATATATITNATITKNTASDGGGIINSAGAGGGTATVKLINTIVAGNSQAGGATANDISGAVDAANSFNNLIGTGGSGGLTNGVNNNLVGVANPLLAELAYNGGTTQTHALLSGSPALDGGSNALLPADTFDVDNDSNTSETLPTDQRGPGFVRIADAADLNAVPTVDIGAYEAQVSVEDITDKATGEDIPLSFSFNVGDAALIVSVMVTSSNTALVPNGPANLSVTGAGSMRTLQITPVANLSGSTTITVTVNGNNSQSMTDTFVLTVNAINDPPVAANDAYSIIENSPLSVSAPGVLANDTDVEGSGLTAIVVSNPSNGTLGFNANGSFTYTPNAGFSGTDSFTYKANDGSADSSPATVTITVNEGGAFQFNSATYNVQENGGNAVITITRVGGSAGTATVRFSTGNGTAGASDYTAVSQTLTFSDGETSKTINIPITEDTTDEADETINLTLSQPGGSGQLGTPSTAVLTIIDNDASPSASINDVSMAEGNGGTTNFVFTVTLSQTSQQTLTVDYATADGTASAGSDYQSTSGTLSFAPGDLTRTITVQVNGDALNEADETFFVNLSNAQNITVADSQGAGTILNDDAPGVQFAQSSYIINEGTNNTPQGFTSLSVDVIRTGDTSNPATVRYITSDQSGGNECNQVTGQASQRCDYTLVGATLRFAAGESTKTIQIPIINDGYQEGDEVFTIELQSPVGVSLGLNSQAIVTIQDDAADATPTTGANNPYLSNPFFVRQNYLDFLGREADAAGFNEWTSVLNNCGPEKGFLGAPKNCDRAHVSHGFFASPEFTDTGFLIYRLFEVGMGRLPLYREFIPDMATLSGFNISPALQQQNVADYLQKFTSQQEFINRFSNALQTSEAEQLIAKLEQSAGVVLPQTASTQPGQPTQYGRQELIQKRASGEFTVGQTLKAFVEQKVIYDKYFPRGHVTMLYFAYLRRDPNLNDPNLVGWNDWVDVFTNGRPSAGIAPRDIHHLIFGFIYSEEYRRRFGQP